MKNLEGRTLSREEYLQEHQDRMIEKARREERERLLGKPMHEALYDALVTFTAGVAIYHGISAALKLIHYATN